MPPMLVLLPIHVYMVCGNYVNSFACGAYKLMNIECITFIVYIYVSLNRENNYSSLFSQEYINTLALV